MFGKKSKALEEQHRAFLNQIAEKRDDFETSVEQMEQTSKRVSEDVAQVVENTNQLVDYAMLNIEEESALLHTVDELSKELSVTMEAYAKLTERMQKQSEEIAALVEENKHYTSPAKFLSEAPAGIKQSNQNYIEQLARMSEYGKQIGVLALNAAIEAGRMGEGGKQFVAASEEIRQKALEYEKQAEDMKAEIAQSAEYIDKLEEVIAHLIALLKENNMSTTRLLKKAKDIQRESETTETHDFSEDMIAVRDKIVGLRNLDEEIAKCGERNKIQLSDIQEDTQSQKNELAEVESDLLYLLDMADEDV